MSGREEESARWIASRPQYMREAEPLASSGWKSPEPGSTVDPREQAENRELFMARESRKKKPVREGAADPLREKKIG